MERLQGQIVELEHKVDRLHQVVEQLSGQIDRLSLQEPVIGNSNPLPAERVYAQNPASHNSFNAVMEHKDVLLDGSSLESVGNRQELSQDAQIRRLTAQLTAAYNRIATLEEQLFACRIHS